MNYWPFITHRVLVRRKKEVCDKNKGARLKYFSQGVKEVEREDGKLEKNVSRLANKWVNCGKTKCVTRK